VQLIRQYGIVEESSAVYWEMGKMSQEFWRAGRIRWIRYGGRELRHNISFVAIEKKQRTCQ
jgi:hypothetical protein